MAKEIIFKSEAYEDVLKIGKYYFEISENLKSRFEKEFFDLVERLSKNPVSFKVYKRNYRTVNLDIFPFRIYYKEEDSLIVIVAVIHSKRSSSFIKKKLE